MKRFVLRFYIVERFVTDSAGERSIARHGHDVLVAPVQIAAYRHAERGRKRRPGVTRAVAIVLAFGTQEKTVEAADTVALWKSDRDGQ